MNHPSSSLLLLALFGLATHASAMHFETGVGPCIRGEKLLAKVDDANHPIAFSSHGLTLIGCKGFCQCEVLQFSLELHAERGELVDGMAHWNHNKAAMKGQSWICGGMLGIANLYIPIPYGSLSICPLFHYESMNESFRLDSHSGIFGLSHLLSGDAWSHGNLSGSLSMRYDAGGFGARGCVDCAHLRIEGVYVALFPEIHWSWRIRNEQLGGNLIRESHLKMDHAQQAFAHTFRVRVGWEIFSQQHLSIEGSLMCLDSRNRKAILREAIAGQLFSHESFFHSHAYRSSFAIFWGIHF